MFFETACLITVSAPLASAILVGFFGKKVGKNFTNFLDSTLGQGTNVPLWDIELSKNIEL